MTTSGQMGAPAPVAQRQSDATTQRKTTTQAGQQPRNGETSVQQGGDGTATQFTDWASI